MAYRKTTRSSRTRKAASRRTTTRKASTRRVTRRSASKVNRPWTREEVAFMRKYYRKFETAWCARQLGRSVYSVRYKAVDLSLKKANPSVWRGNKGPATAFKSFNKSTRKPSARKTAPRRSSKGRSYRATSRKMTTRKAAPRKRRARR